MENPMLYDVENKIIKALIILPGKPLILKDIKGNLRGFQNELQDDCLKTLKINNDFLMFYSENSNEGKMLIVKIINDIYTSLSQKDIYKLLPEILPNLNFNCVEQEETGPNKWDGSIRRIKFYGSHFEMKVTGRGSDIMVLFGETSQGWFACMPDYNAGCHLSGFLSDKFYNTERLSEAIGVVDGITVASAIHYIANLIN